ncbi:hypothetical protein C0W59_07855 [Photobacterium kishitanii]|nr:hypothetical protein C0W59_07855 [Photobacterium kishitanii]
MLLDSTKIKSQLIEADFFIDYSSEDYSPHNVITLMSPTTMFSTIFTSEHSCNGFIITTEKLIAVTNIDLFQVFKVNKNRLTAINIIC